MISVRGFTSSSLEADLEEGGVVAKKPTTPGDTREQGDTNTQYNRQTTALVRGMQLQCAMQCGVELLLSTSRTLGTPPRAPTNGRPGIPVLVFWALAGGCQKARRGRGFIVKFTITTPPPLKNGADTQHHHHRPSLAPDRKGGPPPRSGARSAVGRPSLGGRGGLLASGCSITSPSTARSMMVSQKPRTSIFYPACGWFGIG